jgi:hypothetical protein
LLVFSPKAYQQPLWLLLAYYDLYQFLLAFLTFLWVFADLHQPMLTFVYTFYSYIKNLIFFDFVDVEGSLRRRKR